MNGFVEQVTRDRAYNVVEVLCYRLAHEPGALGLLVPQPSRVAASGHRAYASQVPSEHWCRRDP